MSDDVETTATVDDEHTDHEAEDAEAQDLLADAVDGDDGDGDPEGAEQLGDPGKRALASMKERLKAERARRRRLEEELTAKDGRDEATQAERDALAKANARILRSEVKAAAAGKLADPRDALKLLDLDGFEVGDEGEVDEDEIAEAIDDLLKRKPYLGAAQGGKPKFQGGADQGARKRQKAPTLDEQIAAAEGSGDWATARQLKSAKLLASSEQ